MANRIEITEDGATFSGLLQSYIQSGSINFLLGSGASMPAIKLAGPIEAEINLLLKEGNNAGADQKAYDFISGLSAQHTAALGAAPAAPLNETLAAYSDFIGALDKVLFERKNLLLSRQANIFTTNYDMLIEHAAHKMPSVILNDGFVRAPALNSEFPFAPEYYFDRTYRSGSVYSQKSEVPTINLVKLHGSLSWRKKGDLLVYDPTPIPQLSAAAKADPAKVTAYLEQYFLILPNLRKFHSTMMDRIYYDLLRLFANALERENAVLITFGFSFEDEHILDICRRALRNPTAQLLVFSHTPEGSGRLMEKFAAQKNATVIAPIAGGSINFAKLNGLLKAVLPAES